MTKVLSIGIDRAVADPTSIAAKRQIAYFPDWEVDIFVFAKGKSEIVALSDKMRVHVLGGSSKPISFLTGLWHLLGQRNQGFNLVASQDALFSGVAAWLFSCVARIPFVVQLHGDYLDNPLWIQGKLSLRIMNKLGTFLVRHSDGVRCVSERIRRQAIQSFGVPQDRIKSIPIATPLATFSAQGPKASDAKNVLFVGRLIEEKQPMAFCDIVIPLMQRYSDMQAVIAGVGDLQAEMQKKFEQLSLGSRAHFVGQLDAMQLASWYRSSICLVHTAGWEGWGMPMIEAMACGCPVITTDTGCAGEAVLHERNGLVYPVGDIEGMQKGVERLWNDAAYAQQLSLAAVQDAAEWGFEHRVKDQQHFYEDIISKTDSSNRSGRTSRN